MRLQDELERTLHHPVPDGRYPENADLAALLGDLLAPVPHRHVLAGDQLVPQLREEDVRARGLDVFEGNPVDTRRPIVRLRHRVRGLKRLYLADVDEQSPESPGRFSLRLDVYPSPQVLQTARRLYHLTAAFPR